MDGKFLNKLLNLRAKHALYREEGDWYHHLKAFPGALFDMNGYVLFANQTEYLNHPSLQHRHDLHVNPKISFLKEYVLFSEEQRRSILINKKEVDDETIRIIRQINSIIRSSQLVRKVKSLYQNTCQSCGVRLSIGNQKFYSEVHHLKPLGSPHNGPDKIENMICVCPNCHVQFDLGSIPLSIKYFKLLRHSVNEEYIQYYNDRILVK
jgi:5-methylcytosine-specific restriction protein A